MIDLKKLRQDPEDVRACLSRRGDPLLAAVLDQVLDLDRRRRELLTEVERLKAERNAASQEVARRKRANEAADDLLEELTASGERVKALDDEVRAVNADLDSQLLTIPNLPHPDVPDGDATANRTLRSWGEQPTFAFDPKPHWDLGASLGIMDLPRGAKISGSGFPLLTGRGAKLARALINFMLDLHTEEHGYLEVAPPFLVNRAAITGTGQLPKFGDELYRIDSDDLYLIPTAEVPVTGLHADEMLDAAGLPLAYTAYTPCFRREAGAHGKDTRGLIRVHQFDKVELVRFTTPSESPAEHERLTGHAEEVLRRLELPYRVVELAAGDTGFASARTYDLEVWAAGVGTWLEVSSSSTFTDFQARRSNIRYRPAPKAKPEFVHTLNASGVALPRAIIALLENNQASDGSVSLPAALVPYVGAERLVPGA
ncbi:MAG: serine--tRNA ligase [Gemmatimonadales bacterium]|nr:serine--tRNA ligase [Gemmatimonadales bacterium]